MKWVKENIVTLILAAVCAVMFLFIMSLLRKQNAPPVGITSVSKAYEEAIKAKDETISIYRLQNSRLDEYIEDRQKTDSILLARLGANQPKYRTNDKKMQDVVIAVDNLDKQQLHREYASY